MTREKAKEFIDIHIITSLGKYEYGYVVYAETAKIIIDKVFNHFEVEIEELQESKQKYYTIGYIQGYLDCEKNKVPKDIRELLKDKE